MVSQLLRDELDRLLHRIQPGQMRVASQQIAELLKGRNAERIARQVQPDGSAFAPRKKSRKQSVGGMFPQLRHRIETRATADLVEIGFWGLRTPRIHHYGLREHGVSYTARELLGLPDADLSAALDVLRGHVAA